MPHAGRSRHREQMAPSPRSPERPPGNHRLFNRHVRSLGSPREVCAGLRGQGLLLGRRGREGRPGRDGTLLPGKRGGTASPGQGSARTPSPGSRAGSSPQGLWMGSSTTERSRPHLGYGLCDLNSGSAGVFGTVHQSCWGGNTNKTLLSRDQTVFLGVVLNSSCHSVLDPELLNELGGGKSSWRGWCSGSTSPTLSSARAGATCQVQTPWSPCSPFPPRAGDRGAWIPTTVTFFFLKKEGLLT